MTVAELIAKLATLPQNLEVFVPMHHPETSGDLIFALADVDGVEWIDDYVDEGSGVVVPAPSPEDDEADRAAGFEPEPQPNRRQAILLRTI